VCRAAVYCSNRTAGPTANEPQAGEFKMYFFTNFIKLIDTVVETQCKQAYD